MGINGIGRVQVRPTTYRRWPTGQNVAHGFFDVGHAKVPGKDQGEVVRLHDGLKGTVINK